MRWIRGPMGPGSLTWVLVMRRGCLPQNKNPISATPKSILVITLISTISYQVTEFNQNILTWTISNVWPLYPTQRPWSCIRVSKSTKICRSNFCLHWSKLLSLYFDMQHDPLQKNNWSFDPIQWSRVCKRKTYWLACYCMFHFCLSVTKCRQHKFVSKLRIHHHLYFACSLSEYHITWLSFWIYNKN